MKLKLSSILTGKQAYQLYNAQANLTDHMANLDTNNNQRHSDITTSEYLHDVANGYLKHGNHYYTYSQVKQAHPDTQHSVKTFQQAKHVSNVVSLTLALHPEYLFNKEHNGIDKVNQATVDHDHINIINPKSSQQLFNAYTFHINLAVRARKNMDLKNQINTNQILKSNNSNDIKHVNVINNAITEANKISRNRKRKDYKTGQWVKIYAHNIPHLKVKSQAQNRLNKLTKEHVKYGNQILECQHANNFWIKYGELGVHNPEPEYSHRQKLDYSKIDRDNELEDQLDFSADLTESKAKREHEDPRTQTDKLKQDYKLLSHVTLNPDSSVSFKHHHIKHKVFTKADVARVYQQEWNKHHHNHHFKRHQWGNHKTANVVNQKRFSNHNQHHGFGFNHNQGLER